jgi:hypothetical protein
MAENRAKELSRETQERIYRILGEGVARAWSGLPQSIQQELFESAVRAEGEHMRESIAVFLHREHDRTKSGIQGRAISEPDSKGG